MKRKRLLFLMTTLVALVAVAALFHSGVAEAKGRRTRVEVTVTNLTKGQVFSPAVIALHRAGLEPLFTPGMRASDELRQVAEDAENQALIDLLTASPDVGAVETLAMTPLPPGETASVVLEARGGFPFVSLVGMLVTTNDAFYGVNAVRPFERAAREVEAYAWDAGTEENNELCAYIPGPPCGNGGARAMNGEGYVYVHSGVHGIADPRSRDARLAEPRRPHHRALRSLKPNDGPRGRGWERPRPRGLAC